MDELFNFYGIAADSEIEKWHKLIVELFKRLENCVRRMKIILNGKKVGKGCWGFYLQNKAYFTRSGLTRKIVLHEFYHHLVVMGNLEITLRREEKEANNYAKFLTVSD